jgi:MFS family permease
MVEAVRLEMPFSYATFGLISSLAQASILIGALAAGFLTLRFGALPLILASMILCSAGLAGLALSTNVTMMGAFLLLLGACAALIWVPMVDVSCDFVAKEHQGKALGLMSSGTSYGVCVNSFLLTWVLPAQGWRSLWVVTALLVFALAIIAIIRPRGLGSPRKPVAEAAMKQSIRERFETLPKGLVAAILFMMFCSVSVVRHWFSPLATSRWGLAESSATWRAGG